MTIIMLPRQRPYFEFQLLDVAGNPLGRPLQKYTAMEVLNETPMDMNLAHVNHFLEMARAAPGSPVVMNHWRGTDDERVLVWNALIVYRKGGA